MPRRSHSFSLLCFLACVATLCACASGVARSGGTAAPGTEPACPGLAPSPPDERESATFLVQDGHAGAVNTLALSADGRILASAGIDFTLRIWDTQTGLLLKRLREEGAAHTLAISDDGDVLAHARGPSNRPTSIVAMRLSTDKSITIEPFAPFALSRDGATLAIGRKGVLMLHDARTGEVRGQVKLERMAGEVEAIAFDRAGGRVALAFGGMASKGELALIDVRGARVVRRQPGAGDLSKVIFRTAFTDDALVISGGGLHAIGEHGEGSARVVPGGGSAALGVAGSRIWRVETENVETDDLNPLDQRSTLAGVDVVTGVRVGSVEVPGGDRMAVSADGRTAALA